MKRKGPGFRTPSWFKAGIIRQSKIKSKEGGKK